LSLVSLSAYDERAESYSRAVPILPVSRGEGVHIQRKIYKFHNQPSAMSASAFAIYEVEQSGRLWREGDIALASSDLNGAAVHEKLGPVYIARVVGCEK